MGYITITGDSDGDLHNAAMHNSKFGAIASVLNGNVDHDNLAYPNSELVLTATGKHIDTAMFTPGSPVTGLTATYAGLLTGYQSVGATASSGAASAGAVATADHYNVLTGSVVKIPATMTFKSNPVIVVDNDPDYDAAKNLTFILQRTDAADDISAWTNVAAGITHTCHHAAYSQTILTLSNVANATVNANHYIRLIVQNNDVGTALPPTVSLTVRLSTPHIT